MDDLAGLGAPTAGVEDDNGCGGGPGEQLTRAFATCLECPSKPSLWFMERGDLCFAQRITNHEVLSALDATPLGLATEELSVMVMARVLVRATFIACGPTLCGWSLWLVQHNGPLYCGAV